MNQHLKHTKTQKTREFINRDQKRQTQKQKIQKSHELANIDYLLAVKEANK